MRLWWFTTSSTLRCLSEHMTCTLIYNHVVNPFCQTILEDINQLMYKIQGVKMKIHIWNFWRSCMCCLLYVLTYRHGQVSYLKIYRQFLRLWYLQNHYCHNSLFHSRSLNVRTMVLYLVRTMVKIFKIFLIFIYKDIFVHL